MDRVECPQLATVTQSYQVIRACAELEKHLGAAVLDCSEVKNFGPLGIALIAAAVAERRNDGRKTQIILPKDPLAMNFASEVGLEQFAHGQPTGIGTLEVRQLRALDAVYSEAVTNILLRGVPGMTEDNSYLIQLCLNELLQNVFEWSASAIGCTVIARWYKKSRSVRLAVVDHGIGIPAALRRHRSLGLQRGTDAEVIEAAVTTPRLTSRENRVGGLGLKTIREVVCGRGGRLTVISLSAKVTWSGEKLSRARSAPMRGTAIEIDIRPDAPFTDADTPVIF